MREYHEFHGRRATGAAKLLINGEPVGEVNNNRQVLARFSATETQNISMDLGGPVSSWRTPRTEHDRKTAHIARRSSA